jgi:hypothetical protein
MISPATETNLDASRASVRESSPYDPRQFDWPLAFEAETLLQERINSFLALNHFAGRLAERMRNETGTDFFEWIDHLVLSPEDAKALANVGFSADVQAETANGEVVLHHPRATLPRVILRSGQKQNPSVIALRPEFVSDFAARHNISSEIEGAPWSRYRRVTVAEENGTRLEAVERRAYRGFVSAPHKPGELEAIVKVKDLWKARRRFFADDAEGFAVANRLLNQSIPLVGRDQTCQIYFEEERAERLLSAKLITQEQFDKFMKEGALGSHLENLQRHGGFKGFNQKSVSVVISATDPRRNHFEHAASH